LISPNNFRPISIDSSKSVSSRTLNDQTVFGLGKPSQREIFDFPRPNDIVWPKLSDQTYQTKIIKTGQTKIVRLIRTN